MKQIFAGIVVAATFGGMLMAQGRIPVNEPSGWDSTAKMRTGSADVPLMSTPCVDANAARCNAWVPVYTAADFYAAKLPAMAEELKEVHKLLQNIYESNEPTRKASEKTASTVAETQMLLSEQVKAFNADLRKSIDSRFEQLPVDLLKTDAIRAFREEILKEVDARIAKAKGGAGKE